MLGAGAVSGEREGVLFGRVALVPIKTVDGILTCEFNHQVVTFDLGHDARRRNGQRPGIPMWEGTLG